MASVMTFGTPVVEHWLERDVAEWDYLVVSIRRPSTLWAEVLPLSYVPFPFRRSSNPLVEEAKFVGVIFDKRLSFVPYLP